MFLFSLFKILHIIAGFAAILVFWIPVVTKKGGKTHIRVGWVYVVSMGVVALSALYMGVWRIGFDPDEDLDGKAYSWFLIFISLLSSASAWHGLRVLRYKKRAAAHRHLVELLIPALLLISGIAISVYGFVIDFPLLSYFPLVGIILGATQLAYWLRPPNHRMHWWFEHLGGMLGCCIATITAFTVFGAPRLLGVEKVSILVWFMPAIILVPVIFGFAFYYRKKFSVSKNA